MEDIYFPIVIAFPTSNNNNRMKSRMRCPVLIWMFFGKVASLIFTLSREFVFFYFKISSYFGLFRVWLCRKIKSDVFWGRNLLIKHGLSLSLIELRFSSYWSLRILSFLTELYILATHISFSDICFRTDLWTFYLGIVNKRNKWFRDSYILFTTLTKILGYLIKLT
jgi:hypothetical protein